MPECRFRFFLLLINRSPSDQVFVLLSDIQASSMSRTCWLDLSTDPWLSECLDFPCKSFIPGRISAKFYIVLYTNSRPLSLCIMNEAPNIKKMSIRWYVTSSAVCGIFMKSELVVVISFNNHNTTFASWHIFTCHNALRLFKNSHNTKFCVVAVSVTPQGVVVVFSAQWVFSIFELNTHNKSVAQ